MAIKTTFRGGDPTFGRGGQDGDNLYKSKSIAPTEGQQPLFTDDRYSAGGPALAVPAWHRLNLTKAPR